MSSKLNPEEKKHLEKVAKGFLKSVEEEVDSCLLLEDLDRLGALVSQVDIVLGYQVLKNLRDKGFSKEITELCDKAGKEK